MGEEQSLEGKICRSQGVRGKAGNTISEWKVCFVHDSTARSKCLIGYQGMGDGKLYLLRERPQYKVGSTAKTKTNGLFLLLGC